MTTITPPPPPAVDHPPEWRGLLDADETIVWHGAPSGEFDASEISPFSLIFMLFWTGFSVFWMIMASQGGGFFWMFGLLFFGVGIWKIGGVLTGSMVERRNSYYTLTSKRAFVAHKGRFKKSLKSYPITSDTRLDFDGADPGTILFAADEWTDSDGDKRTTSVGFKKIHDARTVYRHLRDVQTRGDT